MKIIFRNILAVVAGLMVGNFVNMGIITISGSIIPPPDGVDLTSTESLRASMHLFKPVNFLMPFLAHALGTLFGAITTALISIKYKMQLALVIGVFFLVGGVWTIFLLPSPVWFTIVDVAFAYIPMAWIGGKLGSKK